jgi:hypothetical protein
VVGVEREERGWETLIRKEDLFSRKEPHSTKAFVAVEYLISQNSRYDVFLSWLKHLSPVSSVYGCASFNHYSEPS